MYKARLCLGLSGSFKISGEEQIRLFKKSGFDGFFSEYHESDIYKYREIADEIGMIYQSIHAPYLKAADMWRDDEKAEVAVNELLGCVRGCAKVKVPIVVIHTYIGFDTKERPNQVGIENFRRVVAEAEKLNVKIAFENTEGDEFLDALMKAFKNYDNVGFCWDSGHELCYNHGKDMLKLYGDKLIATHLNDNLGISDYNGRIIWTDDLHLLPFDGISDWNNVCRRLNNCGYDDILTFELGKTSKPDRHENDKYKNMEIEEYLAEAYCRACRVAALKKQNL